MTLLTAPSGEAVCTNNCTLPRRTLPGSFLMRRTGVKIQSQLRQAHRAPRNQRRTVTEGMGTWAAARVGTLEPERVRSESEQQPRSRIPPQGAECFRRREFQACRLATLATRHTSNARPARTWFAWSFLLTMKVPVIGSMPAGSTVNLRGSSYW